MTPSNCRVCRQSVEDGIVTLSGSVNLFQDKLDAAKKVKKLENVSGVRNQIVVAGDNVSDVQLQQTLAKKLAYDRVGYRDNAFNYLAIGVKDGVVTLKDDTMTDVARDSALATVQRMPGVKDVVSEVKVLPTSIFDDELHSHRACDLCVTQCSAAMRLTRSIRSASSSITVM